MKQYTLAFTAAVLFSAASIVGYAAPPTPMSAPTYDDQLILKNPNKTPNLGSVVLVPVASPQTLAAVHDYVSAWRYANERIAIAKAKRDNHEQLTKADKIWLHSMDKHNYADYFRTHSIGRVHGYEVAFNWNGENRNKNEYEYFEMPKYNEEDGFTNSYGFNVLRSMVDQINEVIQHQKQIGGPMTEEEAQALEDAILDIMARDQEHVANEELRHYMNRVIWFASKQTVKNKASEEPKPGDEYVVDLGSAINGSRDESTTEFNLPRNTVTGAPIGDVPQTRKVDLRSAISK